MENINNIIRCQVDERIVHSEQEYILFAITSDIVYGSLRGIKPATDCEWSE